MVRGNDHHVARLSDDFCVVHGVDPSSLVHDENLAAGVTMLHPVGRHARRVVAHTDGDVSKTELISLHKVERATVRTAQLGASDALITSRSVSVMSTSARCMPPKPDALILPFGSRYASAERADLAQAGPRGSSTPD